MPVKIRLARHGRKRYAYYHIVVADSRAPRDGRYIERIGSYNPNTNPATIDLDFDKALDWLQKGTQPTDTVRAILSYKGVLYKKHLLGGIKKGAFDEEEAEKRFNEWLTEKEAKIQAKKERLENEALSTQQKQLEAERKIKEERAAAIAAKNSELAAEAKAATAEPADAETAEEQEPPAHKPKAPAEAEKPKTEAPEKTITEAAKKKDSAIKDTEKAKKADAPDEKSSKPKKAVAPSEKKEEKPEKDDKTPPEESEN